MNVRLRNEVGDILKEKSMLSKKLVIQGSPFTSYNNMRNAYRK